MGKTKLYLGLEHAHKANRIIVHQSAYTKRILKRFYMGKAYPLSTPMVVRSLEPNKDLFRLKEPDEEILGPEIPYLNAIGTLMYLAQCPRSDIAFAVNLLARFSFESTRRY